MNTSAVDIAIVALGLFTVLALLWIGKRVDRKLTRQQEVLEARTAAARAELARAMASQARFTASLEELRREFEREVALDLTPDADEAEEPSHSGTSIHTTIPTDRNQHRRSLA